MKITLKHPVKVGEREISELDLKLEELSGVDIEFCTREVISDNGGLHPATLALDSTFHAHVAARASGVGIEIIRKLSARDYLMVTTQVMRFLVNPD